MSTILITGGTVVTASGTQDADVLIQDEKIAMVLSRRPGLDITQLAEVRNLWQFYRDRRPDAYGPLVQP